VGLVALLFTTLNPDHPPPRHFRPLPIHRRVQVYFPSCFASDRYGLIASTAAGKGVGDLFTALYHRRRAKFLKTRGFRAPVRAKNATSAGALSLIGHPQKCDASLLKFRARPAEEFFCI